jgi:signal transduction histidine kinase
VSDELPGRLSAEVEAAAYFCCLEALQNAAKHAGADAVVDLRLSYADGNLCFEATDDGLGFEPGSVPGHGFQNMTDRLGALGGSLQVISALGEGTSVRGRIAIPADAAVG